jgi:hypothetical protein
MEDRAAAETERLRLVEKLFACTESVIRECIADVKPDIAAVILTEHEAPDVIGFYIDSKPRVHMVARLIYKQPGYTSHVDRADTDDVKRVCSMIYDGVHMVFSSVCGEFNQTHNEKIEGLALNFDNDAMAFVPTFINHKLHKFNTAIRKRENLQRAAMDSANLANMAQINTELKKIIDELAQCTLEDIDECEIETAELNLTMSGGWLYIQVEEKPEVDLDLCLSRLPAINASVDGPSMIDLLSEKSA